MQLLLLAVAGALDTRQILQRMDY
jgi:hypothetical protein